MPFFKKKADATLNEFNQEVVSSSFFQDAWKRLRKNKMALLGLIVVVFYTLICVSAPVLPIYPYERQEIQHANLPPSFEAAGAVLLRTRSAHFVRVMEFEGRSSFNSAEQGEIDRITAELNTNPVHSRVYVLGTDVLGRDLLSRIIYGGQISIGVGLVGTIVTLLVGIIYGSIAGYAGGRLDNVMMRFVDIMYGLPYLLIVIILRSIVGQNVYILFLAIALISWLTMARVVRGQVISLKNSEFVQAAKSMGASTSRIVAIHLLPNMLGIIIIYSTLMIPGFIMSESTLSFLGLGVSAPLASWGSLIADGVRSMQLYPWLLIAPAVTMTLFLFSMNFLGDGLRDSFDPQSKNR